MFNRKMLIKKAYFEAYFGIKPKRMKIRFWM